MIKKINRLALITTTVGLSLAGFAAQAGELDPKKPSLPAAIYVKVTKDKDGNSVKESFKVMKPLKESELQAAEKSIAVPANKLDAKMGTKGELDKTSSKDSWCFWGRYNNYYNWGYSYQYSYYPYYSYSYYGNFYGGYNNYYYYPTYSYCYPTYCGYYYYPRW